MSRAAVEANKIKWKRWVKLEFEIRCPSYFIVDEKNVANSSSFIVVMHNSIVGEFVLISCFEHGKSNSHAYLLEIHESSISKLNNAVNDTDLA